MPNIRGSSLYMCFDSKRSYCQTRRNNFVYGVGGMAGNRHTGKLEKVMERKMKMGNADIYGEIMEKAAILNDCDGINVYVCMQGNTNVLAVTVEKNKTQIYSRKEFMGNREKIRQMGTDIQKMIDYAGGGHEKGKAEILQ